MRNSDWGPSYIETNMDAFPVEPWNTYSNAVFILLCLFIAYRTRLQFKRYPFTLCCLPLLMIGTIGGTVYHMTRSHPLWLFMDFVPIKVLCLCAVINLWRLIFKAMSPLPLWFIAAFLAVLFGSLYLSSFRGSITIGYMILGAHVILPFFVYLFLVSSKNWYLVVSAITSFMIAVFFRWFDLHGSEHYFPMGSHFLWHIFGGIASWCLFTFFIRLEETRNVY